MIIPVKDLKQNMMVIYKINYPNGKIYIGLTTDLKRRMYEHNNSSLNKKRQICDLAILKYGKITEVEILEFITDISLLKEREKYWIKKYNSNDKKIGYNLTEGGDASDLFGENNGKAIFTNEQVLDIRKRRFYGERKKDVYLDYTDFNFSSFENIWLGRGYSNIGTEFIIEKNSKTRQEYSSEANRGLKNGRAKASKEDILLIRKRYDEGENISSISKDFSHISKSSVRRIALRESFKDVK